MQVQKWTFMKFGNGEIMDAQHPKEAAEANATDFAVFLALAGRWGLSVEEQLTLLGNPARSTYFKWKKDGGHAPDDVKERISNLLGIYKSLEILFPDAERAESWIARRNKFFSGRTALEVMLDGRVADLLKVRAYLDAQRGG
jgi:hypothetical protein